MELPIRKRVEEIKNSMDSFGLLLGQLQYNHKVRNITIDNSAKAVDEIWDSFFKESLPDYTLVDFGFRDIYFKYKDDRYHSLVNKDSFHLNIFLSNNIVIRYLYDKKNNDVKHFIVVDESLVSKPYEYEEFKKKYHLDLPDDILDLTDDHILMIKLAV